MQISVATKYERNKAPARVQKCGLESALATFTFVCNVFQ